MKKPLFSIPYSASAVLKNKSYFFLKPFFYIPIFKMKRENRNRFSFRIKTMRPSGLLIFTGQPHPSGNGGSRVLFSKRKQWHADFHAARGYPQTVNEFFLWINSKFLTAWKPRRETVDDGSAGKAKGVSI
jgi:hypothetical protein